jgi:4-diphosphocytidyl-2-C-methyl-D-erythritol kinase
MTYTESAYAKINLSLDILGRREDGYHDMRMVMQSLSLRDTVTLTPREGEGLTVSADVDFLPQDESNLAAKAALRFFESQGKACPGLTLAIQKHIPVCAGMAGGSSDAAATLRLLRQLYAPSMSREDLEKIGEGVGSDVPYCVRGGTALAEGRGEVLTDLPPLPPCYFVVCKPAFSIATPELFAQVRTRRLRQHPDTAGMLTALERGDLEGVARRCYNVFEDVLPRRYSQVFEIKAKLLDLGAMAASMTGSGPTVFGLFRDRSPAQSAAETLAKEFPQTFFCERVGPSV